MKRILLVMFVCGVIAFTAQAQIVHNDNVEIEKSDGAKLDLTHTGNNRTWQLVSGLYNGFQIGYLTGNLTGTSAPFFISEAGKVGIGTTAPSILTRLTVDGGLTIDGDLHLGSNPAIITNGVRFLSYNTTNRNMLFGFNAGNSSMSGQRNMFFGTNVGLSNTTGQYNTAMGYIAGSSNTTGSFNSFFGYSAGTNNTTGTRNMFVGHVSGQNNISGADNMYLGFAAGQQNNGDKNTFIGSDAGKAGQLTHENVMIGYGSGQQNNSGTGQNTYIGVQAGSQGANGSKNVGIGYQAGFHSDGEKNVYIGYKAGLGKINESNRLYIGNDQPSTIGGKLIYGEFDNGKVGINTTSLDAGSALTVGGGLAINDSNNLGTFNSSTDHSWITINNIQGGASIGYNNDFFWISDVSSSPSDGLVIKNDLIGIGTSNPTAKLDVNGNAVFHGKIEATKVRVSTTPQGGWPDYVFEPEFKLRPLSEVEAFVKDNKHLPEVPSAKEVETNGIDLGNMDATLLKKVEELTLYMIEMNKKIEKLEEENKQLKELVKKDK